MSAAQLTASVVVPVPPLVPKNVTIIEAVVLATHVPLWARSSLTASLWAKAVCAASRDACMRLIRALHICKSNVAGFVTGWHS